VRQQKRLISDYENMSAPECKLVFKLDAFENIEAFLLNWQRTNQYSNAPDTSTSLGPVSFIFDFVLSGELN
jgi:hypothetical protein